MNGPKRRPACTHFFSFFRRPAGARRFSTSLLYIPTTFSVHTALLVCLCSGGLIRWRRERWRSWWRRPAGARVAECGGDLGGDRPAGVTTSPPYSREVATSLSFPLLRPPLFRRREVVTYLYIPRGSYFSKNLVH